MRLQKPILVQLVKCQQNLTKSDLITLSYWAKNARNIHRIKSNNDDFVKERTGFALSSATADPDRVRLKGVGWAVASAILHWFHQDHYPIWSGPARYSVRLDETRGTQKPGEWEAYVKFCRKLAKENKVDMRTLDRALWKHYDDEGA